MEKKKVMALLWIVLLIGAFVLVSNPVKGAGDLGIKYKYKYVFPFTYMRSIWSADDYHCGIVIFSVAQNTKVLIDTNFNGPDNSDKVFTLSTGDRLYIGNFPDVSGYQKFQWDKNPLVVYSNKPLYIQGQYSNNDFGDYDDSYIFFGVPVPSTKLIGPNVQMLYITAYSSTAKVYINGNYVGQVSPGDVLTENFSIPQTIVVTSTEPIVAMAVSVDPAVRSRTYAFPLMPPMSGKFLIPDSNAQYAYDMNTQKVSERYLVLDSSGNIIENESLPATPMVLNLQNSEVFVFRTYYYQDPWGDGAPRYAMSAAAIKPAMDSTLLGWIGKVDDNDVNRELVFYAASDVKIYEDYNGDGTIDNVETLHGGRIYQFSDRKNNTSMMIYVVGNISGEYLDFGGWTGQLEGVQEEGTTPLLEGSNFESTSPPQKPFLIAYYSFDHCDARDGSGNGYDGTVQGDIQCTQGVIGKALNFTDYLQVVKLPSSILNGVKYATINFWIKTTNGIQGILSSANNNYDNELLVFMGNGSYNADYHNNFGRVELLIHENFVMYSPPINDGKWHMVTVVLASNFSKMYIDGRLVNQSNIGTGSGLHISQDGLWIGNDQDCVGGCWDSGQQFKGALDELRFYRGILNASAIRALYEQGEESLETKMRAGNQVITSKTVQYLTPEDLSEWKYYRNIIIKDQSGETLKNFQVLIKLNATNFDFSKAKPDGSDIRIVDENGNFLPYWIEEWNRTAKEAKIWTIIPEIPAYGEVKLRLYYGNPSARSRSDGNKVFEFFDGFNGDELNTSKWYIIPGDDEKQNVSNGFYYYYSPFIYDNSGGIITKRAFSAEGAVIIQTKAYFSHGWDGVVSCLLFLNESSPMSLHNLSLYFGHFPHMYLIEHNWSKYNSLEIITSIGRSLETKDIAPLSQGRWNTYEWALNFTNKKIIYVTRDNMMYPVGISVSNVQRPYYHIQLGYGRGIKIKIDYILVRKYASKGPLVIVGSEHIVTSFLNVTPYVPPKPREESVEKTLRKLALWFNESKEKINQTEPKGVWDFFIERPYIPKLPEFSTSEGENVMEGIFNYMLEVNNLSKPDISDNEMRYLMEYLSNVSSTVTMPNGVVIQKTSPTNFRIDVPGFEQFYISLTSKSRTAVKHVTFFKKDLNVRVTAHGDVLTAYMPVSIRRFNLTVTLNYLRVSGFVNGYPIFDREFIFPFTDVSDMVLYNLEKALRVQFDKPILDGDLYGTLELEGGVYSPIGGVSVTGDLIQLDVALSDILNGFLGSIELEPSLGYNIEEPNGDEFSAEISMSVPIADFRPVTHTKIFLYYAAYKVFDSDFLRENYLYPELVSSIENLSWKARNDTYLSYEVSTSILPSDNEVLKMLRDIESPGWTKCTAGSFVSLDWDISYGQTVSTNLLPLTSKDSRILYHVGIDGDMSLNIGGNSYFGYGIFLGPIKLGIGGTVRAKIGFSTPILGLTVVDPPTHSSSPENVTIKLLNFTAEDLNGNGYFDGVILKFNVSGLSAGNYTVYSPLYSSNGTFLISGVNESVHGNTSLISVWIPGQYLYQTHYSGNVKVGVIVQNSKGALLYSGTPTGKTFKLDYRLFDHVSLNATIKTSETKNGLLVMVKNIPQGAIVKPYLTKPGWIVELNTTNGSFFVDGMHIKKLSGKFSIVAEIINESNGIFLGSVTKNVSVDPAKFMSKYPWILNVQPATANYSPAVLVKVNVTRASNLSIKVVYDVANYTESTTSVFYDIPAGVTNFTVPLDPGLFVMTDSRSARVEKVILKSNGLTTDTGIVNSTFTYAFLQKAYLSNVTAIADSSKKSVNISFLVLSHAGANSTVRIALLSGNYTMMKYLVLPKKNVPYNVSLSIPLNTSAILKEGTIAITVYDPSGIAIANERLRVNLSTLLAVGHTSNSMAKNISTEISQSRSSTSSVKTSSGSSESTKHIPQSFYVYIVIAVVVIFVGYVILRRRG